MDELDEYQYIRQLTIDRYEGAITQINQKFALLIKGVQDLQDILKQIKLEQDAELHKALHLRYRAEYIVWWLEIDTFLREQGKNYAEEHERQSRFCLYQKPNY